VSKLTTWLKKETEDYLDKTL